MTDRDERMELTGAATLRDVAAAGGVSIATASRVLHGGGRVVRESNRQKVLDAAVRLGYTTNLTAQAVSRGSTQTVLLVVDELQDDYVMGLCNGVIQEAAEHGLTVLIAQMEQGDSSGLAHAIRSQQPQAVIIMETLASSPNSVLELRAFDARGGEVVVIGDTSQSFHSVRTGDHEAARTLAIRLLRLGYLNPVVIAATGGLGAVRAEGFAEGYAVSGGPVPAIILASENSPEAARSATSRTLMDDPDIDLVFTTTDAFGFAAMAAARDIGRSPASDIGFAGFGGTGIAAYLRPALSTVVLPALEIGIAAMRLSQTADGSVHSLSIPATVSIRSSTPERRPATRADSHRSLSSS